MLYHETYHFQESAEQARVYAVVRNWATKLTVQQAEALPPDGPYRKKNYADLRIIVALRWVEGRAVLCLLDVFHRGDREYGSYREDPADYGRRHYEQSISSGQLQRWIKEQHPDGPEREYPGPVPDELLRWLQPPELDPKNHDIVVFDSSNWAETFRQTDETSWHKYRHTLEHIVLSVIGEDPFVAFEGYPCIHYVENDGAGLLFSVHRIQDPTAVDSQVGVLLLSALSASPAPDAVRSLLAENYPGDPYQRHTLHPDDIARCARRCYPWDVVESEQLWYDIQRDKTGSMALSVEEQHVLRSVSTSAGNSQTLPIFINGRAGSGKSTMLYYLFTSYCRRFFNDPPADNCQLVFLSYSTELLRDAKSAVDALLRINPQFRERSESHLDNQPAREQLLAGFFTPFRSFLMGMLDGVGHRRFCDNDAINFLRFRSLYRRLPLQEQLAGEPEERARQAAERARCCLLPETRNISAELAWHVIRTYLKGWDPEEDDFTPTKYDLLPSEERSVSKEDFRKIYDTVWQQWYSQITSNGPCWDDQDLIRYILQNSLYPQNYLAVFCDEAQDFTRCELRLLMSLPAYSSYNLGDPSILCLPFAFAGDPFQTLNPTGFRWENVRATFTSEVIFRLDPARRSRLKQVNECELRQNYRSQDAIVRLSNTVLLWRSAILRCDLRPQAAWRARSGREPEYFVLSQNLSTQELIEQLGDVPTILPCEDGEESSFIESDPELRVVLENLRGRMSGTSTESQDRAMKSFLAPATAKGREFDKVVLYKFGHRFGEHLKRSLGDFLERPHGDMQLEYYLNKLYVAVTRAKAELLIVDTADGMQHLWRFAQDAAPEELRLRQREPERWKNALGVVSRGVRFEPKLSLQEKKREAKVWKETGMKSRDPIALRRARGYFLDLAESTDAAACEAFAFEFEGKHRQAGQRFLSLSRTEDAWRCFWNGHCWYDLDALKPTQPVWNSEQQESFEIAAWMLSEPNAVTPLLKFCEFLPTACEGDGQPALRSQWQKAVQMLAERVDRLGRDAVPSDKWRLIGDVLGLLFRHGFDTGNSAAECFYRAEAYSEAVKLWHRLGHTTRREYTIASAYTKGFPEGLALLASVDEHRRIIGLWNEAGKPGTTEWLAHVLPTMEKDGHYTEAFPYYLKLGDVEGVLRCLKVLHPERGQRDIPQINASLELLTERWLQQRSFWPALAKAYDTARPRKRGEEAYDHTPYAKLVAAFLKVLAACDVSNLNILTQAARADISFAAEWLLFEWRAVGRKLITVEEAGAALEKLGTLLLPLTKRFYEEYSKALEQDVAAVARIRWLVVATREQKAAEQEESAANPVLSSAPGRESPTATPEPSRSSGRAESLKIEIGRKRHDWGIDAKVLTQELLETFPQVRTSGIELLSGPAGYRADWLAGGNLRLVVSPFRISVFHQSRRLQIMDERSDSTVYLNIATGQSSSSEDQSVTVSHRDDAVLFEVGAFGLSVRVRASQESIEVAIEQVDWQAPVQIRMPQETTEAASV